MSVSNTIQINLRVPEEVAADLDQLAKQENATRIDVARQILLRGVAERKRAQALDLYRQGKVSKSKAAELAGISLWEMIELIAQADVPSLYSLEEAVDQVRRLVAQVKMA